MRRQSAQMSTLAAACTSPLHSASCAVDKSTNRRAYASAYVPMQDNASAHGDLGALSWLAGMSVLVCAGLESSTCLNFDGDSRRMRAYALCATGDRSINSCADSRRMCAYKPGLKLLILILMKYTWWNWHAVLGEPRTAYRNWAAIWCKKLILCVWMKHKIVDMVEIFM